MGTGWPLLIGRFVKGGRGYFTQYDVEDTDRVDNVPLRSALYQNTLLIRFGVNSGYFAVSRDTVDWGWCIRRLDDHEALAYSFDRRLGYRDDQGRLRVRQYAGEASLQVQDVDLTPFGSNLLFGIYAV